MTLDGSQKPFDEKSEETAISQENKAALAANIAFIEKYRAEQAARWATVGLDYYKYLKGQ